MNGTVNDRASPPLNLAENARATPMVRTETRASQLVRWSAKKGAAYVRTIALDAPDDVRRRVGSIFGILAVEGDPRAGEAVLAHLEDAFLRGTEEAITSLRPDAGQEAVFEKAVARVNQVAARLFGDNGLSIEPERITAALVAIKDQDVVATVWGRPSVLLFHPAKNGDIVLLDLVDDSRSDAQTFRQDRSRRCFANIIAGRMGRSDRVLLATHDLRDFVGDPLASIVTEYDPTTATEILRERLSPLHENVSVAAMVLDIAGIRYIEDMTAADRAAAAGGTQASVADMLRTRTKTEEILSPSLIPEVAKKVGGAAAGLAAAAKGLVARKERPRAATTAVSAGMAEPLEAYAEQPMPVAPSPAPENRAAEGAKEALKAGGRLAAAAAKAAGSFAKASAKATAGMVKKEERRRVRERMTASVDGSLRSTVASFNDLSGRSRALLFAALAAIMLLNQGISLAAWQRGREEAAAAKESAIVAIEQQIDSAEASMIYRDETRARSLLKDAETAIAALSEKDPREAAAKTELSERIAKAHDALRRVVALAPPEILATVADGEIAPVLTRLASRGDGVWASSSDGRVFRISLADGAAERMGVLDGGKDPRVLIADGGGVFAATGDGTAAAITPAKRVTGRTVDLAGTQATIDDAAVYNSRLYVLDAAHNRILRHPAVDGGFAAAQFYLKDGTDVSKAVSLAIDGAVYVLSKDGSVIRIVQGSREDFSVHPADPPVTDALRLRTDASFEDLYILDGASRVLRYGKKTGNLVAQYASPELDGAADIVVDEKAKTILAAKGNQLLRFSMPE